MTALAPCTGTSPEQTFGDTFRSLTTYREPDADNPWPNREIGTGGIASLAFLEQPYGYAHVLIFDAAPVEPETPSIANMKQVKAGFGRTMSCLPEIFGVSRQTLYNWLRGETPSTRHREPLRQLSEAAAIFIELGFTPTSAMLGRTVADGRTFSQLIAKGADGRDTAKKLVRLVRRGSHSRASLDALLAGRKSKLEPSDFGHSFPDEQA